MASVSDNGGGKLEKGWRIAAWGGAASILAAAVAAKLTLEGFDWGVEDFVFVSMLLLIGCLAFEVVGRMGTGFHYRAATAVALGGGLMLLVANAAVGFIGDSMNPANLMFLSLPVVGVAGALASRWRPQGLARTLFAMAAVQVAILGIVLAARLGTEAPQWPIDVIKGTGFFTLVWIAAGLLYRQAARTMRAA